MNDDVVHVRHAASGQEMDVGRNAMEEGELAGWVIVEETPDKVVLAEPSAKAAPSVPEPAED